MEEAKTFTFPVLGILGGVLVVLKALGMISLSWPLVLLPFWGPLAVVVLFAIVMVIGIAVAAVWSAITDR